MLQIILINGEEEEEENAILSFFVRVR